MASQTVPVDDGCTGFFDMWRGIDLIPCCNIHDIAWAQDMDPAQWIQTNIDLSVCFWNLGAWELAIPAFIAVTVVGAALYWVFRKAKANK